MRRGGEYLLYNHLKINIKLTRLCRGKHKGERVITL